MFRLYSTSLLVTVVVQPLEILMLELSQTLSPVPEMGWVSIMLRRLVSQIWSMD
jgi:hypothetical protein